MTAKDAELLAKRRAARGFTSHERLVELARGDRASKWLDTSPNPLDKVRNQMPMLKPFLKRAVRERSAAAAPWRKDIAQLMRTDRLFGKKFASAIERLTELAYGDAIVNKMRRDGYVDSNRIKQELMERAVAARTMKAVREVVSPKIVGAPWARNSVARTAGYTAKHNMHSPSGLGLAMALRRLRDK